MASNVPVLSSIGSEILESAPGDRLVRIPLDEP